MHRFFCAFVGLAVAACGSSASNGGETDAGGKPNADASAGFDARLPDASPTGPVRFVLMGDTGTGSDAQYAVAAAIQDKCAADGCQFVVLLGDNIYDSGVDSTTDDQWRTKFREPYADIDLPFYAVLGNHDYGGVDPIFQTDQGGLGNEWDKGPNEVAYSQVDSKWVMPDTHYTFQVGNVGFIVLDTNSILWGNTDHGDQTAWYSTALSEVANADWVMVMGHHPLRSNGAHGNAGQYESLEIAGVELPLTTWLGIDQLNGTFVKNFYENTVCGTADVVFAGHDHNRQWINEPDALCGAELIVSGAGAKVKDWGVGGNQTYWQDATTEGFMYMVVDGDTMTGQFIDKFGNVNFERTVTH